MPRLDARGIGRFLEAISACSGPQDFRRNLIEACQPLCACDSAGYNEIDMRRQRAVAVTTGGPAPAGPLMERFGQLAHEHPLIRRFERSGDTRTYRLSDCVDRRGLHRLALYNDVYRALGIECQMAVTLPAQRQMVIGLAFNRSGRDFSDDDRAVLDLVRPHLVSAFEDAEARRVGRQALRAPAAGTAGSDGEAGPGDGEGAAGTAAVIALDGLRRVRRATGAARATLAARLGSAVTAGRRLPEPLDGWVRACLAAYPGRPPAGAGLTLDGPAGPLHIWCAVEEQGPSAGCMLVLRQERRAASGWEAVLTPREAGVLALLAEGLSGAEAAERLHISPRTLHKHLEHAYEKMGVRTRAAAVLAFASRRQAR